MKHLNNNLVIQRLSGYVIEQVQKSFNIASSMRLRVDTDDHRRWIRSGGSNIKVLPFGEQFEGRTSAPIEITYDWEREAAAFWCDDIITLVRPERQYDFDPFDIGTEHGEINVEVRLGDGLERIAIWENLPANPKPNTINRPPKVVGMAR